MKHDKYREVFKKLGGTTLPLQAGNFTDEDDVLFRFNGHTFRREGVKKLKNGRMRVTCAIGGCCSKSLLLHTKITMKKKDLDDLCATKVKFNFGIEPVMNTILDVSTTHITKSDDRKIMAGGTVVVEHKTDNGYFVWMPLWFRFKDLPNHFSDLKRDGYSASFIKIIGIAFFYKCNYVHFDSDGTVYEGLKKYDW